MDIPQRLVSFTETCINLPRYLSYKQKQRQQRISALRDWIEVLLSVFIAVLLINQYLIQLFVIPSGSMIPSLQINDRVVVNKLAYGLELYPYSKKYLSSKHVERGTVIPFVSPEYNRRGPFFDIAQRLIFLLSFSKIDLDIRAHKQNPTPSKRLASQPTLFTPSTNPNYRYTMLSYQPPLLVKRVIAIGGDRVRFSGGDIEIRLAGSTEYHKEEQLKKQLGLDYETQRDLPNYNSSTYYSLDRSYEERVRNSYLANPHDISTRSRFLADRLGDAIPTGYFEPFGDNRDHSHDGRWFGILNKDDLQGRVSYIVAPFNRFRRLLP